MTRIAIIGGGVGGLQLGLSLRAHGIAATVYTEHTPEQQRAFRLSSIVCRNGPTRARERALGIDHWDDEAPDLHSVTISGAGARPFRFTGALTPPSHVVDMRIYCGRLLEDFAARGGEIVFDTLSAADVEALSARFDLTVVASGRGQLANLFPTVPEHSPHAEPQRVVVGGLYRGIAWPEPLGFDVSIARGHGEILSFPLHSFEPGLTGLGIEVVQGGAFSGLLQTRYDRDPRGFESTVLGILREHAPAVYERVDPDRFAVARPLDVGYVAITPVVRRGFRRSSSGNWLIALGDAHIVMDPLTGQGANKASHAAWLLGEAIRDSRLFDEEFCMRVEHATCEYALPVSDACNARLQPPPPHVGALIGAACRRQAVADFYGFGFSHPDRYWKVVSRADRTEAILAALEADDAVSPDRFHALTEFCAV